MLLDIKAYFQLHTKVSMHALTQHFQVSPEVMSDMMKIWIGKGNVRKCSKEPRCGVKCLQCRPETIEWFEWVKESG